MKRVPSYWWDFNPPGSNRIIIESDDTSHPNPIAVFFGENAPLRAQILVEDLRSGRADPRRVSVVIRHDIDELIAEKESKDGQTA